MSYINELSYSRNTLELYALVVEWFIEYMREFDEVLDLDKLKPYHLTGFVGYLKKEAKKKNKKKELSSSTILTYRKGLVSFLEFVSTSNDDNVNFKEILEKSKPREKNKKAEDDINHLDDVEMDKIIGELERRIKKKNTYINNRNSLLVKLMRYGGLRISEALNLKLENFSYKKDNEEVLRIKILAKGGNYQAVIIQKDIIRDELSYFQNIAKILPNEYIMKTTHGTRLSRETMYLIMQKIYDKLGIKRAVCIF